MVQFEYPRVTHHLWSFTFWVLYGAPFSLHAGKGKRMQRAALQAAGGQALYVAECAHAQWSDVRLSFCHEWLIGRPCPTATTVFRFTKIHEKFMSCWESPRLIAAFILLLYTFILLSPSPGSLCPSIL